MEVPGIASRKAATAALKAHVAVLEGTPLRRALSEALQDGGNLGGKERRFIAFAVRELSRHLRLLNVYATAHGHSKFQLHEDQAIFRYALWRRYVCGAPAEKIMTEVGLPGPLRPRGLPDQVLVAELAREVTVDLGDPAARHSFPSWLAERLAAIAPEGEYAAVLEALSADGLQPKARCLTLPDAFVRHGEVRAQRARLGLDAAGIRAAAKALLGDA